MYQTKDENIISNVDWITFTLYILLVLGGWVSIYGASYQYDQEYISMFDISGRAGMQLVWIGTSLIIGFILLKLDSNIYDILAYYIYIIVIGLLLITLVIAPDIKGSRSWLVITDSIRFQPAEFAKFAVALALAKYMSSYGFKLISGDLGTTFKNLGIITALILTPALIIIMQSETGSALVFSAFILVLFREGLPGIFLVLIVSAILLFVVGLKYSETELGIINEGEFISALIIIIISIGLLLTYEKDKTTSRNIFIGLVSILAVSYLLINFTQWFDWGIVGIIVLAATIIYLIVLAIKRWSRSYLLIAIFAVGSIAFVGSVNYLFDDVLQPHQQKRIKVTLGMEDDPMGAGYNVNQSQIAIGSGGLLGKGFLNGTQTKLKYVPEQTTDFIFCTVGEEQGFIGSVAVLLLFLTLILRLIFLAERQKNTFGRVYGYCVASIFLFHIAINIGMVIGLTPVIGIPLPFFSYGGSSLWAFSILLFIFLRIDMARKRR